MRVIITGGIGLIGGALAADLLKDEHEVIALSRRPERATGLPTGMRVERWDARTAEGWESLVDGADAIVKLAGATIAGLWTVSRKRSIRESRLNARRGVVEAIQRASEKPRVVRRPFLVPVPALALRLLAGEMSTVLLDGQRATPDRLHDLGFAFRFSDAETALRDLLGDSKD